jgi:hypothetical protein
MTRLNIQFTVCLCAGFQASHALHIGPLFSEFLGILHTFKFGIWYSASSLLDLVSFLDADFAGCGIDRKNTSSTYHFLRSSLVYWSSQKQSSIAQSTTEAKYVAASPKSYVFCTP